MQLFQISLHYLVKLVDTVQWGWYYVLKNFHQRLTDL